MSEKKFSSKEAIGHGINITKKYFMFLLGVILIYVIYNIGTGILKSKAGQFQISKSDIKSLVTKPDDIDIFYQYLIDTGYIDKFGRVQQKLQDANTPDKLELPPLDVTEDRGRIFNFLNQYRYRLPFPKPVYYFISVLLWILSMLMGIGYLKISLRLSRDEKPEISELFTNYPLLPQYILASICYWLVMILGFILLIVPGIIVAIMLQMYPYLIVDKNLGPIESLKRSRVITKGSRWHLCVFGMLLMLFNLAGLLCLVIGLFFTVPASSIAAAYVYQKLENYEDIPQSPISPV